MTLTNDRLEALNKVRVQRKSLLCMARRRDWIMEAFSIGGIMFLGFAIVGLVLLITGIIFVAKNIKWKRAKDSQGISSTANIKLKPLFIEI